MRSTNPRQTTLRREQQKANSLRTGLGGSKPINELSGLSAAIREPTRRPSGVCSSNETTEAVFCKLVMLCADNDADEAIQIQNLLQYVFCIKSGIVFAVMPCSEHVLENFSDAVNGSAWTIMLLTKFSECIFVCVSVFHLPCQCS